MLLLEKSKEVFFIIDLEKSLLYLKSRFSTQNSCVTNVLLYVHSPLLTIINWPKLIAGKYDVSSVSQLTLLSKYADQYWELASFNV